MSNLLNTKDGDQFISSAQWRDHFNHNIFSQLEIPWEKGEELTYLEWHAIAASIQEFQLGESSEGHHFYRCACEYAKKNR